jgi:tetratricopeptide (TPR) repeat protein
MAKRVNTRFLVVLTVAIGGVAAMAFVGPAVKNRLFRHNLNLATSLQSVDDLLKKGELPAAKEEINRAYGADHTNKEVLLKRGDVYSRLTEQDGQQALEIARNSWQSALEMDPSYKPAAQRLVDSYWEQDQVSPNPKIFAALRDAADRLRNIDPEDGQAQSYYHIAILQQWMSGTPKSEVEISKSIAALEAIQKKNTSASDPLLYLAAAKHFRVVEAQKVGHTDVGDKLIPEIREMLDAATAAHPDDTMLSYRAFTGYRMLSDIDRTPEAIQKDRNAATAALGRARSTAKVDDLHFSEIHYAAAEWAHFNHQNKEAEDILRQNYEARDTDQRARFEYARVLGDTGDAAKRDKAIEILKLTAVPNGQHGWQGISFKQVEAASLLQLTRLRVQLFPTITDPARRTELLDQIDDDFNRLSVLADGNSVPVWWLQGSIRQLKHDDMGAVESLGHALTLVSPKNPERYRIMYELARSYRNTAQNAAAEKLLAEVVDNYDSFWPARFELVQLYLADNNIEAAAAHVEALGRLQGDNTDVIRLQIAVMNAQRKTEEAKKYYARLPEATQEMKLVKAQAASDLQDYPDAARLLEAMAKEKPTDSGIAMALATAYLKCDQKPKAKEVVAAQLSRDPTDPRLLVLQKELDNATPEDIEKVVEGLIKNSPDPFLAEIELGRRAIAKSNFDSAMAHVRAAEKLRTDDIATWDLYFQIYLKQKKWDLASKAAENLARIDADHAGGGMYRWQLAMAKGDFTEAVRIGGDLTQNRGDYGLSWMLLAQAYQANGQYNEALDKFRSALERQSNNVEAYRGIADCYDKLSQPERARDAIEKGRQRFPQNIELRELALAYDVSVNPAAVIPVREKILADAPGDPENYVSLASACLRAAIKIAPVDPAQAAVYTDKARDVLTKGVAKFPTNLRVNGGLAECLQDAKHFDDGLRVLTDLSASPEWKDKPGALLLLSDYYTHAGKMDDGEKYLRQAWDLTKHSSIEIEQRLTGHLVSRKKFDEALEVLQANPEDPIVVRLTLETQIAARNTDAALKGLKAALAKSPDNPELLNLYIGVNIDAQRYADARQTVQKVLAAVPSNDVALYYQALIEMRDPAGGKMELVKKNLSNVVTVKPRNVQYKILYADALTRARDLAGAALQLEDAIKVDPFNREARAKLLDTYTNSRKWSQFEAAIQFAELNPALNGDPLWYRSHAFALAAQQQYPAAIAKIKDAISLAKNDPTYARDYLNIILQSRDYPEVEREAGRLIEGGHNEWWVHHVQGRALAAEGKKPEALEQFDKAIASADAAKDVDGAQEAMVNIATDISLDQAIKRISARPQDGSHWPLIAVALRMRVKDWPGAQAAIAPLVASKEKLSPADRLSAVHFAAEIYQAMGDAPKAKEYYLQWLALAPNDVPALNNIACLLTEDLKDPRGARQYSQKAYDLSIQSGFVDPLIQDTQGWVLVQCGGPAANDGRRLLESVVDAHPDFIDSRYHLGVAYLNAKLPSDAARQLTIASDAVKEQEKKNIEVRPQLKAGIEENLRKAQASGGANAAKGSANAQ